VLLPIDCWSLVSEMALRYAWTLAKDIHVLHVRSENDTDKLRGQWSEIVEKPDRLPGQPVWLRLN